MLKSLDAAWSNLRRLFETTDPEGWPEVLQDALKSQTFRWFLAQTGASNRLIEAHGRFKEELLRRSVPECRTFRELRDCILAESRDFLHLEDAFVPIEQLFQLTCADFIHEFGKRNLTQAETLNNEGWDLHKAGREGEAMDRFDRSIDISPRFCLAWINKGIALKTVRRFDDAIACYDHVLEVLDPESTMALYNKAFTLTTRSEADVELTDEAVQSVLHHTLNLLDKAISLDPGYQQAATFRDRVLAANL